MKEKRRKEVGLMLMVTGLATAVLPGGVWGDEGLAKQKATALAEVVVTATRTPHTLAEVPVETVVLTREDIDRSNAQNVMEVLNSVPGITSAVHDDVFGTYTWRAKMRGLNFNDGYGLILVDGQRIMGSGQSGGMGEYGIGLNQLPLDMVERIEVVKGPSSALYGSDAMAGVINIITRKTPAKASGRAGVSYGWYKVKEKVASNGAVTLPSDDGQSRNLSNSYISFGDHPTEKLGYLIHYSQEAADDISQSPVQSDRHSVMAKVDYGATDELSFLVKGEASDYEKQGNRKENSHRLSLGLQWQPNNDHLVEVKGYTYGWDFEHGYPGYSYGYKYGQISYNQVETQYTWYAGSVQVLTFGGEAQQQGIDYQMENSSGALINVGEDVETYSLYGQDELTPMEALTVVLGLRFDDHSNFGSEVNPKLSLMYSLGEGTIFRAGTGRAFKSPTIRQLYYDAPYEHGSFYVQSNRNLRPEIGWGYTAGVEQWLLDDQFMTSLGIFRNDIDDMVVRVDSGTTYNSLPLLIYQNVDKAMTQGVELLAKWQHGAATVSLAYTYTDSENKATDKELTYVPNHTVSLTPAYDWPDYGLGVSGVFTYTSSQYKDSDNSSQIDGNSVVDARVYKKLAHQARLTFEADNILDSDKGDNGNFRSGRTLLVKLDVEF